MQSYNSKTICLNWIKIGLFCTNSRVHRSIFVNVSSSVKKLWPLNNEYNKV